MDRFISTWLLGLLVIFPGFTPVVCSGDEVRPRRQVDEGPYPTYTAVPKTSFSCDVHGPGYYADMETRCQVFHICHANIMDSFICPEGTVFNQKVFVCDWWFNVNCDSSPDFYSLNNRIGSASPFRSSPVQARVGSGRTAGQVRSDQTAGQARSEQTAGQVSGAGDQRRPLAERQGLGGGGVGGRQLGSPSQASVTTTKLNESGQRGRGKKAGGEGPAGKTDAIRTLLPNLLTLEVPIFVASEVAEGQRPSAAPPRVTNSVGSAQRPPQVSTTQRPVTLGGDDGGQRGRPSATTAVPPQDAAAPFGRRIGSLPREQSGAEASSGRDRAGYLPVESEESSAPPARGSYLPTDSGVGSAASTERDGYLPRGSDAAPPTRGRGSYLPTGAGLTGPSGDGSGLAPPAARSYLPEGEPGASESGPSAASRQSAAPSGGSYLDERPPSADATDSSFLLPPPLPFGLPNSLEGPATAFQRVDEYSPAAVTTRRPLLPPMNLLPLTNERRPPPSAGRLPSTTESYGVLDEGDAGFPDQVLDARPVQPTVLRPLAGRQGSINALDRRLKPTDRAGARGRGTNAAEVAATTPAAQLPFRYDFDRVRSQIQQKLRGIEPFEVAAADRAQPAAVASRTARPVGPAVGPSAGLYSLASLPM
ncbi:nascent polypeptide-associated complex subunit alpha, muscle-specific form-like [Pollicipes pollicipes]|uniref:nascent polypeptide-associated complex subunit alpha, muscle-specific form-like n=1 Tax=Pollicipes pollicipes TaxID=41117 RepID=UPI001885274A|nr:nascent polypeptide-associated complex subunit alpha, muscle-specific form-like [Pollicipes pollicipes]